MEPDGDPPPFWSPSTATILHQQRRRRAPSPILSPVSLILLLPILALLIIFFLLLPFLSHTSQLLRPTYSVKKTWDSFNILLVVFAILCGVFARRNAEEAPGGDQSAPASAAAVDDVAGSDHVSFSDATAIGRNIDEEEEAARWFDGPVGLPPNGANRLRRSSSSYPDLRQQDLLWETGDVRYRLYDDIDVDLYRQPAGSVELNGSARREESGVRVIPVDTFEVYSARPPSPDPPLKAPTPPSPPPPPPVNSKPRQSVHSVPRKQKAEKVPDVNRSAPPPNTKPRQLRRRNREPERVRFEPKVAAETENEEIAAPPPPPSVVEMERFSERRLQRKKSGAKELATAIASLYTDRKRKKKLKRKNISESSSESSPTNVLPYIPPPPPPPPPPVKVFTNLFKKSTKHKRVDSVAATAPPPPPPPPPSSIFNNIFKTGKSKRFSNTSTSSTPPPPPPPPPPSSILNTIFKQGTKSRRQPRHKYETRAPPPPLPPPPPREPVQSRRKSRTAQTEPPEPSRRKPHASWKPPLPAKQNTYYEEYLNSGAQSPLVPLPPPPPPPFKMPDFKFVARGDFVRILSAHSSRCSSPERPDLEDVEMMSVKSSDGGDSVGGPGPGPSGFCPSPDVNLKADSFIARLKGEWRMDKMKSLT